MWTLGELAARLEARLCGDPGRAIAGLKELVEAGPHHLAPLFDPSRLEEARRSPAALLIAHSPLAQRPELDDRDLLICADGAEALARALALFDPGPPPPPPGVDPRAAVDPTAELHASASVGPFAVVERGAHVGPGARLDPFCYVGRGAEVGPGCHLYPGAVLLERCTLGWGAVLGPGAVVGYRGFGFFRDRSGAWQPIPARGGVALGPEVELGANACADAGTLAPTRLERGVKVDNLVQVGHNGHLGQNALLCAQVGLAGSVRLGAGAVLAGQVGVADHREVGAGARLGAQSGVARDVPPGAEMSGSPAMEHRGWLRSSVLFARLGQMARELARLRRQVDRLLEQRTTRAAAQPGDGADPDEHP